MKPVCKEGLEQIPLQKLKDDRLITMKRVAEILGVCLRTAYDRWAEGHFVFVKHGGAVRVWESSVYHYLRRLTAVAAYEHGLLEETMQDFLQNDADQ